VRRKWIFLAGAGGIALAFLGDWLRKVGEAFIPPAPDAVWMLPLLILLLAIAVMPFLARRFWERHYHHVAVTLAAIVAVYYLFFLPGAHAGGGGGGGGALAKGLAEYVSFILLVASLFIVSGGILIRVRKAATPGVNVAFLLIGAILANLLGTTGAAMLLIRPYLRLNRGRLRPYHIVFFIFLVANIGGCLTPIGDPPLFLGYLKGIPFWWFVKTCWPMWAFVVVILLAMFWILEMRSSSAFTFDNLSRDRQGATGTVPPPSPLPHGRSLTVAAQIAKCDGHQEAPAISIHGSANLLLIVAISAMLLLHDTLQQHIGPFPWRESVMVIASCLSLWLTPQRIYQENVFHFAPIREIAFLFLGIFCTMVPALNYLDHHLESVQRFLHTPGRQFFACGALSSVLDNAPTFLAFLEAPLVQVGPTDAQAMQTILADPALSKTLLAISLASVFFGAMTYIGNGPNFMVKSIVEHDRIPCPSFFGYIFAYALPILLPIFLLVWLFFLR